MVYPPNEWAPKAEAGFYTSFLLSKLYEWIGNQKSTTIFFIFFLKFGK